MKKGFCIILAFVLMVSMLPVTSFAATQSTQAPDYNENYDPYACVAYADKYCKTYNTEYPNFNDYGGDCANFVSQCIYAGGMQMVENHKATYESHCGTDCWFFKAEHYNGVLCDWNRSGTWTEASLLKNWMSKKGKCVAAKNNTIYIGSPVFYKQGNKIIHAAICVGYDKETGIPIVDAHNRDYQHKRWDIIGDPTTAVTVQLTPEKPKTLNIDVEKPGTLIFGDEYALTGRVISYYLPIESISAEIRNSSGELVGNNETINPTGNKMEATLNVALRKKMKPHFSALEPGRYKLVITVKDKNGNSQEKTVDFKVSSIIISVSIPKSAKQGDAIPVTGSVKSIRDCNLKEIQATITGVNGGAGFMPMGKEATIDGTAIGTFVSCLNKKKLLAPDTYTLVITAINQKGEKQTVKKKFTITE